MKRSLSGMGRAAMSSDRQNSGLMLRMRMCAPFVVVPPVWAGGWWLGCVLLGGGLPDALGAGVALGVATVADLGGGCDVAGDVMGFE